MPLPTPNDGESQSDFMSRCMGSDVMREDFEDQDQRAAVCLRQFRRGKDDDGEGEKVAKRFNAELTAEPGERAIVALISTTSVDRDGDVVMPSGVDLKNFNKIPTVLMMHDSQKLPVGKVPPGGIRTMPHGLMAKAIMLERPKTLPTNVEWPPDTLLDLFRQQAPLGFSIGFRIKNARIATKKDKTRFGPQVQRIITDWELLEFSVVPIPANQDALAVAVSKIRGPVGAWTKGALGISYSGTVRHSSPLPRRLSLALTEKPVRLKV